MPTVTEPDRVGVHGVATLIHKELGWILREQHESDHGIDALVETVVAGQPTGRLIALQIKSVPSCFKMTPGTSASSTQHREGQDLFSAAHCRMHGWWAVKSAFPQIMSPFQATRQRNLGLEKDLPCSL